jgi:AAA domain, putative AbiEii toxin, Type IV TA system
VEKPDRPAVSSYPDVEHRTRTPITHRQIPHRWIEVQVRFTSFEVSDGSTVNLPPAGVTLFVGPNNAGKSQALKDLMGLVGQPQSHIGRAIVKTGLDKLGSAEEFMEWVIEKIPVTRNPDGQTRRTLGEYGSTTDSTIVNVWGQPLLQHISSVFVYHADATSRLSAANSVMSINFAQDPVVHPLQRAYLEANLENELRLASTNAFGVGLAVDRYAGNVISLRVGTPPVFEHDNGVPSPSYVEALHELPLLEQQGDGMRSYLGLLLHILGGTHQITLVDELEAFLHPPQARLLGLTLAQRTLDSQQLFVATHSTDVVQGVLAADAPVTIVRLTREGDVNKAAVLDPEQVKQLWSDPLLRYSNLLDGLFHDAVILCEGDADCRYYNSVFDSIYSTKDSGTSPLRTPQLLFSHCGGKGRLASVAISLRAVSIPVVIVSDFDILNDSALLERTVKALGADFEPMRANLARVTAALEHDVKPVSKLGIREAVLRTIDSIDGETVGKKDAEELRAVIRVDSGWDKVKRSGVNAIPQGAVYESCVTLLAQLKDIGLLVVPAAGPRQSRRVGL